MEFREPFWRVLHPNEYRETRNQLLKDWTYFGFVLVMSNVLIVAAANLFAGAA